MNDFRRTFSEEEQREVIKLAARLQKEQGEKLTEDGLVRAAAEAGIEADYVAQAIAKIESEASTEASVELGSLTLVPLLLVAQWLALFSMLGNALQSWQGLEWWLVIALCLAVGAVQSRSRRSKLLTTGLVLASAIAVAGLCGGFLLIAGKPLVESWPTYLLHILVAESAATLAGGFLGGAIRKLPGKRPKRVRLRG
ncbi:MAG TPA: hypothetical protein VMI31_17555 [Fimbriimonadaceae bacterium]|nr:hypothetical protein [Fimbriimonadaceae bacterium]